MQTETVVLLPEAVAFGDEIYNADGFRLAVCGLDLGDFAPGPFVLTTNETEEVLAICRRSISERVS